MSQNIDFLEKNSTIAPEEYIFLEAIQDEQKRNEVISILKSAGLLA